MLDLTLGIELTDEQLTLQSEAKRFAEQDITPVAAMLDETSTFPKELLKKAASLGLMNLLQPSEYGGTGLSLYDTCLVVEQIAAGCAGFATSLVANDLALTPIIIGGTNEQKKKFIQPIVEGQKFASFCLSEPGAGSDAAGVSTTIIEDGDSYVVNGNKQWITNGGYASQYTVFGTMDPAKKHKGISCVVIQRDLPGVSTGSHENKLGQRCSNTVPVRFENVRIPKVNMIGKPGEGFPIAMKTLDTTRPVTAVIATGIGIAALKHAVNYSKERKQFGAPIATFQGIQFMLADMATDLDAARLLSYRSAKLLDEKVDASLQSSMGKRFAADAVMKITTDAVQIFGGYGYTKEYPVEKLMRDSKLMQIYEGTSQVQRIVIAKHLIK